MRSISIHVLLCCLMAWAPTGAAQSPYERAAEEAREQYASDLTDEFRKEAEAEGRHDARPFLFARGNHSTTLILFSTSTWSKEAADSYLKVRLSKWLSLGFKNVIFMQLDKTGMKKGEIVKFSVTPTETVRAGVFATFEIGKKK